MILTSFFLLEAQITGITVVSAIGVVLRVKVFCQTRPSDRFFASDPFALLGRYLVEVVEMAGSIFERDVLTAFRRFWRILPATNDIRRNF